MNPFPCSLSHYWGSGKGGAKRNARSKESEFFPWYEGGGEIINSYYFDATYDRRISLIINRTVDDEGDGGRGSERSAYATPSFDAALLRRTASRNRPKLGESPTRRDPRGQEFQG